MINGVFRTLRALSSGSPTKLSSSPTRNSPLRNASSRENSPRSPANASSSTASLHLVILGPGDVGKNTVYKQFCKDRKVKYTDKDIQFFKNEIYVNFVLTVGSIYDYIRERTSVTGLSNSQSDEFAREMSQLAISVTSVNIKYDDEMHDRMIHIFKDEEFAKYFSMYFYAAHCPEGIHYFVEKIDILYPESFTPTHQDIIHVRRKNTGIVSSTIEYNKKQIQISLVAGQRSERKKWPQVLKTGSIMIFVASLSDYDQQCYEDESKNRQRDALDIFETYVSREQFLGETVYLLLNKVDVFKQKYERTGAQGLQQCYSADEDGFDSEQCTNSEQAIRFIVEQFEKRFLKHRTDRTNLIIFQTSAVDSDSVDEVLERICENECTDPFRQLTY